MEPPRIEGYRVLDRLGEGGLSVVYLAEREGDRALVALKVLKPGTEVEEKQIRRLLREASVGRQLHHPHILPVRELREWGGEQVLVLDYVRGASLREWAKGFPPEDESALTRKIQMLARIADALEYAHGEGIVHRDVKPANVLVREDGHAFLIDFGLARRLKVDSTITSSNRIVGSPPYMSPEQIRGRRDLVDHRTDVYSLGATAFEVLAGRFPFLAETQDEMLLRVLTQEPPRLLEVLPSAPAALEGIVLRALEKDPRDRYPSAGEMRDDLERLARGLRPNTRPGRVLIRRRIRAFKRQRLRIGLGAATGVAILAVALALPLKAARARAEFGKYLQEGDREFVTGRAERSLHAYREAELLMPESPEPLLRQASVYADYHLYTQASRCLREAEARGYSPGDHGSALDAYHIGLAHLLKESYAESAEAFRTALDRDPELFEAYLLQFRALDRIGKREEARSALERFRQSRNELDPLHSLARFHLSFRDGDPAGAVKILEELRRRKPPSEHPIWLELYLAMAYERLGDAARALENHERAVERTASEPLFRALSWSRMGGFHVRAGHLDEATACARSALEAHSEFGDANMLLAVVEGNTGDLEGARSHLERVRRKYPDDPIPRRLLAEVVFLTANETLEDDSASAEEQAGAYAKIDECLQLYPEHPGGLLRRGIYLWLAGRNEKAMSDFEMACRLTASWSEPSDRPIQQWERYFGDSDFRFDAQVGLFGTACQVGRADLAESARAWIRAEYDRDPNRRPASLLNLAEALAECPVEILRDCALARRLVADPRVALVFANHADGRAILQKIDRLCP